MSEKMNNNVGDMNPEEADKATVSAIETLAKGIYEDIKNVQAPVLVSPQRSLKNVRPFRKRIGYLELGDKEKTRTLSVNTVKTFAQSLKMMGLSKELVKTNDFATKRDAYYQSKNWGTAAFKDQPESDTVMDDIEAMMSRFGLGREHLRYVPDEHGGSVAGALKVHDKDLETGEPEIIDCTRFGSGAYSIPSWVEHLGFETDADFILCVETAGMFQRLQSHKFWRKRNCILVSLGGVPSRACRRFVRRLSEQADIPVYAFVDCDPYGIANIYRSLKVGSGNAAHVNHLFCVPKARFLGVTPDDIKKYKLPTHPLKEIDIKRANDALANDPFFKAHPRWQTAINRMLKMGVRAEQQALARWGLNYVIEEYLPEKLDNIKLFLP
jgi:DNA topoisomerase-6 subunit A